MALSLEERRRRMAEQVGDDLVALYESDTERVNHQGGDIVEY